MDMQEKIIYMKTPKDQLQYIYYHDCRQSYPTHTHASHIVLGCVLEGAVAVVSEEQTSVYGAGSLFCILPDTAHGIEALDNTTYSMISSCIPVPQINAEAENHTDSIRQLKQMITDTPEHIFSIAHMAACIRISPYHMIRQFKAACGLTPHQFQIQCRVRKAQRLLEEGRSVTETAYAAGFCDQSHFDRCFRKIVRLTPSVYQKCLRPTVL